MPWAWTLPGNFTSDGNGGGVIDCSSPRRYQEVHVNPCCKVTTCLKVLPKRARAPACRDLGQQVGNEGCHKSAYV